MRLVHAENAVPVYTRTRNIAIVRSRRGGIFFYYRSVFIANDVAYIERTVDDDAVFTLTFFVIRTHRSYVRDFFIAPGKSVGLVNNIAAVSGESGYIGHIEYFFVIAVGSVGEYENGIDGQDVTRLVEIVRYVVTVDISRVAGFFVAVYLDGVERVVLSELDMRQYSLSYVDLQSDELTLKVSVEIQRGISVSFRRGDRYFIFGVSAVFIQVEIPRELIAVGITVLRRYVFFFNAVAVKVTRSCVETDSEFVIFKVFVDEFLFFLSVHLHIFGVCAVRSVLVGIIVADVHKELVFRDYIIVRVYFYHVHDGHVARSGVGFFCVDGHSAAGYGGSNFSVLDDYSYGEGLFSHHSFGNNDFRHYHLAFKGDVVPVYRKRRGQRENFHKGVDLYVYHDFFRERFARFHDKKHYRRRLFFYENALVVVDGNSIFGVLFGVKFFRVKLYELTEFCSYPRGKDYGVSSYRTHKAAVYSRRVLTLRRFGNLYASRVVFEKEVLGLLSVDINVFAAVGKSVIAVEIVIFYAAGMVHHLDYSEVVNIRLSALYLDVFVGYRDVFSVIVDVMVLAVAFVLEHEFKALQTEPYFRYILIIRVLGGKERA